MKIELLAPAGDLEKLKIAIQYGADAVYIGGENYGLRAKAKNFTPEEMQEGINFAHENGKKIYVTANIFAHNEDFNGMEEYFLKLEKMGVDAIIVADPGVFSLARRVVPNMEIHISTQANNTNYHSVQFWHDLGAKRIVVARELSFAEIKEIKDHMPDDFDIEAFVHGAMCISYSGRCLLSNYMTNRDANHGECAQPCRWKYNLVEEKRPNEYMPVYEDERGTYIFNSKDLCMVQYLPKLIESGVNSFKIEGRIKTSYYVANIVKTYREAIDDYMKDVNLYNSKLDYYMDEIRKCSHRDFTLGFYENKPTENDQVYTNNSYIRNYEFVGLVLEYDEATGIAVVEQRNKFNKGDEVEVFRAKGEGFLQKIEYLRNMDDEDVESAPHPQQKLKIKFDQKVNTYDILRMKSE